MNLMFPFKTKMRRIGGSNYLLIPPKILKQLKIPEDDDFGVICALHPYQPTKMRILQGYMELKKVITVVLLNDEQYTGIVGHVNQQNFTINPENPDAPDSKSHISPLMLIKEIHVGKEVIPL